MSGRHRSDEGQTPPDDLEFVGVDKATFTSVDVASVLEMLANARSTDRLHGVQREIDGKWVVVVEVAEFDDVPIVCTNTIWSTEDPGRGG